MRSAVGIEEQGEKKKKKRALGQVWIPVEVGSGHADGLLRCRVGTEQKKQCHVVLHIHGWILRCVISPPQRHIFGT